MVQFLDADDGSALWELVAAQEGALFALPDNKLAVFALITFNAGRLRWRLGRQNVPVLVDIEDGFAIWIAAASEERAEPAVSFHHRLAADGTFMFAHLFFEHLAFFVTGGGGFAIRIGRAAQEPSVFAESINERLAALGAFIFAGGDLGFGVFHLPGGCGETLLERAVKIL